jgi:hypothetical protein
MKRFTRSAALAVLTLLALASVAFAVQVDGAATKLDRLEKNVRQISTGVDMNSTSSVTPSVYTGDAEAIAIQAVNESGTTTTCVATLQGSVDGTTWVATATTVTGATGATLTAPVYPFHRLKVTTAQATGVATLGLFAKAPGH